MWIHHGHQPKRVAFFRCCTVVLRPGQKDMELLRRFYLHQSLQQRSPITFFICTWREIVATEMHREFSQPGQTCEHVASLSPGAEIIRSSSQTSGVFEVPCKVYPEDLT